MTGGSWKPSRHEERLLWYLRLLSRYGVGVGGLVWALATRQTDTVLLMVLGALATSTDMFTVARDLIRASRDQERERNREENGAVT